MRRPENNEFQPNLTKVIESEKKTRDREWWWMELNKSERKLNVTSVEDALTILGDSMEFSVQLTNEAMGNRLAYLEARRYGTEALVDSQYSMWPADFQSMIRAKLSRTELQEKLVAENWTLRDLCHRFVNSIAEVYGFESRYWMTRIVSEQEIIDRSIAIGAFLLKQLMKKNRWRNDIDGLLVTSAVLPENLSIQIVEFARKQGFLSEKTKLELRDIRLACNSTSVAIQMVTTDVHLRNKKRIAILSLDPLGDMMGLFENVWQLGQYHLPVFGNGFKVIGIDGTQISNVAGTKIVFEKDTTKFTRYYQNLPNLPQYAVQYPWIEDQAQMLIYGSVSNPFGNHQAILLNLPKVSVPGLPVESDEPFNYAKKIVETYPDVVSQVIDLLGEDALRASVLITNASSESMSRLIRKKIARLLGLKNDNFALLWSPELANASTASFANAFLHKDISEILGQLAKSHSKSDVLVIIGAGTGIGASLALFVWLIKKKKRS